MAQYVQFIVLVLLLSACSAAPAASPAATSVLQSGGGSDVLGPEAVVKNFFGDLRTALADKDLAERDVRKRHVDRLAAYFAPNERETQRTALGESLGLLVRSLAARESKTRLTLDLRGVAELQDFEVVLNDGDTALVRPVDAQLVLVYSSESGSEDGESISLEKLLGRPDVPLVRIGDRWFLTED